MTNIQLKFEAELPNSSKVVTFTWNYKIFRFQGHFHLEDQVHQFSGDHLRHLDDQ